MATAFETQNMQRGLPPQYQLRKSEVDIPAMVSSAEARLLKLRRRALAQALISPAWKKEYPSLTSLPVRTTFRGLASTEGPIDPFDRISGAVTVPSGWVHDSTLGRFFTDARTMVEDGVTQLRGTTYYQALDFSLTTQAKRLTVIQDDLEDGLHTIASVDRAKLNLPDYLLLLGVMDHVKMHTITMFHALTYPERSGKMPEDSIYVDTKKVTQDAMLRATRAFYQACLGQSFDTEFQPESIKGAMRLARNYLLNANPETYSLTTYPEVTHPIIIMLGAHEAAKRHSGIDTIIGIPSGGTEVSTIVNLMYENLYPDQAIPAIIFVPLSFHFRKKGEGGGLSTGQLVDILRQSKIIEGRSILVTDDNSNSASTLQRMAEAAAYAGATQVAAHIAEIDPARVMANYSKQGQPKFFGVLNMLHPDLESSMGIAQASHIDGDDLRRKTIKRKVEKAHKKLKKQNESDLQPQLPVFNNSVGS